MQDTARVHAFRQLNKVSLLTFTYQLMRFVHTTLLDKSFSFSILHVLNRRCTVAGGRLGASAISSSAILHAITIPH